MLPSRIPEHAYFPMYYRNICRNLSTSMQTDKIYIYIYMLSCKNATPTHMCLTSYLETCCRYGPHFTFETFPAMARMNKNTITSLERVCRRALSIMTHLDVSSTTDPSSKRKKRAKDDDEEEEECYSIPRTSWRWNIYLASSYHHRFKVDERSC
jgi:hypothetical protein